MGKDTLNRIAETYDVAIIARGSFFDKGRNPGPGVLCAEYFPSTSPLPLTHPSHVAKIGERKLHMVIEGQSPDSVTAAKTEMRRILEEATLELHGRLAAGLETSSGGKYNVV
jgi:hypothetical protein